MKIAEERKITIGTFDLAKGIGMLIVIAGHTMTLYKDSLTGVLLVLGIWGQGIIPMFYIISGFGCKVMTNRKCLKKSAKDLLIPYLWVAAFTMVLFPVFHYLAFRWWPGAISEMTKTVVGLLTGCKTSGKSVFGIALYESGAVWYLLALFWTLNFMNVIWQIPSEKGRMFAVCLCILAGLWCKAADIWYFCISQGFMAVGYVYLGHHIKQQKWLKKSCPLWQLSVMIGIFLLNVVLQQFSILSETGKEFLDYLGTGCLGLVFIRITLFTNQFSGKVLEGIRKIGRYSYYIVCIHSVEMSCIPWYLFAQNFAEYPYLGFCLQMILRGALIGLGCVCLVQLMKYRHQRRRGRNYV